MIRLMAVAELVSVETYLHTSFEHDAEFLEGKIVGRAVPTWKHAAMQGFLIEELRVTGRRLGLFAVPEQRVQIAPNRFRVPDVCVLDEKPAGDLVTRPPYLCIEILSPDDRTVETPDKVREYLNFGVRWVWVIDPLSLTGEVHAPGGVGLLVADRLFSTDRFSVDLSAADL